MNDSSLESTEKQKYVVESRKFFPLSLHSYTIFYLNSEKSFVMSLVFLHYFSKEV